MLVVPVQDTLYCALTYVWFVILRLLHTETPCFYHHSRTICLGFKLTKCAYFFVPLHQQQVRPVWRLKGKRVKNLYSPAAVSCPWRRKQRSLNAVFGKTFTAWQQVRIPAVACVYVASWVRFGAFGSLSLACFVAFRFVMSCLFTSY